MKKYSVPSNPHLIPLVDLRDVNISNFQNGWVVTYNSSTETFDLTEKTSGASGKSTLLNNTTIPTPLESFNTGTYRGAVIDYMVYRDLNVESGQIFIAHNSNSQAKISSIAHGDEVGTIFSADISSGDVRLLYTTTNTGQDATFYYFIRRMTL